MCIKPRQKHNCLGCGQKIISNHPVIDCEQPPQLPLCIDTDPDQVVDGTLGTLWPHEQMEMPVFMFCCPQSGGVRMAVVKPQRAAGLIMRVARGQM